MATLDVNALAQALQNALRAEVDKAVTEAVEEVLKLARERVRQRLGAVAVSLFDSYSLERMGRDLMIRVQLDPPTGR